MSRVQSSSLNRRQKRSKTTDSAHGPAAEKAILKTPSKPSGKSETTNTKSMSMAGSSSSRSLRSSRKLEEQAQVESSSNRRELEEADPTSSSSRDDGSPRGSNHKANEPVRKRVTRSRRSVAVRKLNLKPVPLEPTPVPPMTTACEPDNSVIKSPASKTRAKKSIMTESGSSPSSELLRTELSDGNETEEADRNSPETTTSDSPISRRRTRSESQKKKKTSNDDEGEADGIDDSHAVDDEKSDPANDNRSPMRKRTRQATESDAGASPGKAKKLRVTKHKTFETRVHLRLVPVEEEPMVRAKILKEQAHLLVCDEPLEVCKEQKIHVQIVESTKRFEESFLDFLVFKRVYGHALVHKYFDENPSLGRWCAKVRHWKSKGKDSLTESRMRRLTEAGFCWDAKKDPSFWKLQNTCEQAQDRWEEMFEELLRYKKEFGNCLVPKECRGKHKVSKCCEKCLKERAGLTHRDDSFLAAVATLGALGYEDSKRVSSKAAKGVSYSLG